MMPPVDERERAVTLRSISLASRTPTTLNSTLNDGATAWIALKKAGPMVRSRSTATRVTRGAISLSSSSHFAPKPNSWGVKPVAFPARARHAVDKSCADRVTDVREHDGHGAGGPAAVLRTLGVAEAKTTSGASARSSSAYL